MDTGMRRASAAAALLAAASCAWGSAFSQTLRDPTEPPSGGESAGSPGSAAGGGTVLQSVIVSEGRKLALIDGRMYRAGDKLGDATIAAISANEVTLHAPEGVKVLKLYPSVNKTPAGAQSTPPVRGKGGS